MSVSTRKELIEHFNHEVVCVTYASCVNVAIECEPCGIVLADFDNDDEQGTDYDNLAMHAGHALEVADYDRQTTVQCVVCGDELVVIKR